MKTKFLFPGMIAVLTIACNNHSTPPNQNVSNPDSVMQDKTQVHIDTAEETTFRQHEEEMIKENNEKIAELKEKIRKEKGAADREYNTQLDTLKVENTRMETRLQKIGNQTKADWETFKYDFNKDMDTLGKSISRFADKVTGSNNN